jgi:RND family efflux transporter MFP subunit
LEQARRDIGEQPGPTSAEKARIKELERENRELLWRALDEGVIDFVDNRLDPGTGVIRARAVFPNPGGLMAPGFFARVRIPGSGRYTARLVHDNAIGSDQGKPFVFVLGEGDTVRQVPVEVGPLHEGLRVVKSGLGAGDRVVVDGVALVRQGMKAEVTAEVAMRSLLAPASEPTQP